MLHSVAKKVLFSDFNCYEAGAHNDSSPKIVNSQGLILCYAASQWAIHWFGKYLEALDWNCL